MPPQEIANPPESFLHLPRNLKPLLAMTFYNRFKKQKPEMDDCQHLSALGDDPDAWDGLDDEELKQVISVKFIEFWLDRLEAGCSEAVFGSAVAAIARMPVISQLSFVVDVERLLPAYPGGEPMKLLRRSSFTDYLDEIRPRLKALEAEESEPKVIPRIFEIWDNTEAFRGMIG